MTNKNDNLEIERKFLLDSLPIKDPSDILTIEQHYINKNGERFRVRMSHSEEKGKSTCYHTVKNSIEPGVNEEIEKVISFSDFIRMKNSDPDHFMIQKERHLFPNGKDLWEVDDIKGTDIIMAECEISSMSYDLQLPAFIEDILIREVTEEEDYSNYAIAKIHNCIYD